VSGGSIPSSVQTNMLSDMVKYTFARNTAIAANSYSAVLLFTSDFAPQFGEGVISGALSGSVNIDIPTPTPEPATMFLIAIAAPAILRIRRRRT
jgi:hypothetical protein